MLKYVIGVAGLYYRVRRTIPTELLKFAEVMRKRGNEFGATTGSPEDAAGLTY